MNIKRIIIKALCVPAMLLSINTAMANEMDERYTRCVDTTIYHLDISSSDYRTEEYRKYIIFEKVIGNRHIMKGLNNSDIGHPEVSTVNEMVNYIYFHCKQFMR